MGETRTTRASGICFDSVPLTCDLSLKSNQRFPPRQFSRRLGSKADHLDLTPRPGATTGEAPRLQTSGKGRRTNGRLRRSQRPELRDHATTPRSRDGGAAGRRGGAGRPNRLRFRHHRRSGFRQRSSRRGECRAARAPKAKPFRLADRSPRVNMVFLTRVDLDAYFPLTCVRLA